MKIIIPSYKRAGRVDTRKTIDGAGVLAVHEFEADEYRKKEGGDIMVLPDKIRGNISRVRNWILDHAGDPDVLMMDDDITSIGYRENLLRYSWNPAGIMRMIDDGFRMARELGVRLWGTNIQDALKFYREYTPFSFTSVVLAPLCGHVGSVRPTERYDEHLYSMYDDYDFFLKTIARDRRVLRFNKYFFVADHFVKSGGCTSRREMEEIEKQKKYFIGRWGRSVARFRRGDLWPIIHVPIRGI